MLTVAGGILLALAALIALDVMMGKLQRPAQRSEDAEAWWKEQLKLAARKQREEQDNLVTFD